MRETKESVKKNTKAILINNICNAVINANIMIATKMVMDN